MPNVPLRDRAVFWAAIRLALIVGVGAAVLQALFFWRPAAGWVEGLFGSWKGPIVAILGIGVWAGVVAFWALLLNDISRRAELLKALAAMWRPVVLLAVAGYLLFVNDQGSELGLSLLGQYSGWPIVFLFLALIYWAANTWHTARLGIHNALERGALGVLPSQPLRLPPGNPNRRVLNGDEFWIYWPPRLLGVCAHFFAAINLSWAAWNLPPAAWGDSVLLRCFAGSAPFAIACATAFVWAEDVKRSRRGKRFASDKKAAIARWTSRAAIAGAVVVLGGLAYVAHRNLAPDGFLPGTISISLSAVAFLALISWLRNLTPPLGPDASDQERAADDARQQRQIQAFTIGLFALACLVGAFVWISPTHAGRFLGSMVVAYFSFGAILALINVLEFAVDRAAKSQVFGEAVSPRTVGAYAVAFLVALGLVNAWLHPFHRVRVCDGDCVPAISPNQRPKVADAARAWYAQAKAAYDNAQGQGPVPMLIVATAGGGVRAAYWTATVLEKLEGDFEAESGDLRPYLFAISGVSGGSVGAAAFEAALTQRDENRCKPDKPGDIAARPGDKACPPATDFLKEDFLAPALASLVFRDTPASFLPDLGEGDRGTALERSFEHASGGLLARPFLNLIPYQDGAIANGGKAPLWRPILLLNATHEETGDRIIAGHVLIERNVFVDSLDALNVLQSDVRASTAAHNSARFTYVSPAGNLGWDHGSVIDGGYFENFGALTALELAHAASGALNKQGKKVRLVILMISSDPDLDRNHMLVRINESTKHPGKCLVSVAEREIPRPSPNYFSVGPTGFENALINEFFAPFQGLEKVREAHGNRSAAELAVEVCTDINSNLPASNEAKMNTLDLSEEEEASVDDAQPFDAKPGSPYFAHLAMCEHPKGKDPKGAPIQPPLGWVLSKATQDNFHTLLDTCGNEQQLPQLEIALRGKPPRSAKQEASAQ